MDPQSQKGLYQSLWKSAADNIAICVDTRYHRHQETIGSLGGITEPDTAAACVDVFDVGPFDSDGSEFAQKMPAQSHPSKDVGSGHEVQSERTGSNELVKPEQK